MAKDLLDVKLPFEPFAASLKTKLREELQKYADHMQANVSKGTEPATPGRWRGNINAFVRVEELDGGFGFVTFGVGLSDSTPEQVLWQAYIFNFGSGQYGRGTTFITSKDFFYNVDTDAWQNGRGDDFVVYPQFAKQKNRWFDDVVEKEMTLGALNAMVGRIVRQTVKELFATGQWKLKGHNITVRLT